MTTRKFVAETAGPVTIDAGITGHGGIIAVRVDEGCDHATLTIHTANESGPAFEAVRDAVLRQGGNVITASVRGQGGSSGGTTIVSGGGTVVQTFGTVHGTVTGMQIGGNGNSSVTINGVQYGGGNGVTVVQGSATVEITAVVPPGSSVIGHTHSADVDTSGPLATLTANTQSGDVIVERADQITVKTMSGDVHLKRTDVVETSTMSGDITIADFGGSARLKTMSGDITVHATSGGNVTARTMSGDIYVTATQAAIDSDLDVQSSTMSGRVRAPQRRPGSASPRRRS